MQDACKTLGKTLGKTHGDDPRERSEKVEETALAGRKYRIKRVEGPHGGRAAATAPVGGV